MARGGAALLAVALAVPWLSASPAAAAENLAITIDSPTEGRTYERNTVTVEGRVDVGFGTAVDTLKVIVWRTGQLVKEENVCPCDPGSSVPFSVTTPPLDTNGPYSVRVVASGYVLLSGLRVRDASLDRSFALAVRPAAPTNLKAERLADNKVKLTWGAVPAYPDLLGYLVFRAAPGAAFQPIKGGLTDTSYTDPQPAGAGGNFQYKVAAVREGAVPGDSSQWLVSESNLASVSVPAPSVPTSTSITLPDGSSTGGTSSGATDTGAASLDLSQFFSSAASDIRLPAPSAPPSLQLPDTGFSPNLPFTNSTIGLTPPTQSGRPATTVARRTPPTTATNAADRDSNRRALLIPVAAGCVLCVAALHLRWLSRRLAASPLGLDGGGPDGPALEPAEPDLDLGLDLDPVRQPVGAGSVAGPGGR